MSFLNFEGTFFDEHSAILSQILNYRPKATDSLLS